MVEAEGKRKKRVTEFKKASQEVHRTVARVHHADNTCGTATLELDENLLEKWPSYGWTEAVPDTGHCVTCMLWKSCRSWRN